MYIFNVDCRESVKRLACARQQLLLCAFSVLLLTKQCDEDGIVVESRLKIVCHQAALRFKHRLILVIVTQTNPIASTF